MWDSTAYLQRVVNNRGRIRLEYALGRGRTDLLIEWHQGGAEGPACTREYVIEYKVRNGKVCLDRLIREGREQVATYIDGCGAESGHLVIFDLRQCRSWDERLYRKDPELGESPVTVWGL